MRKPVLLQDNNSDRLRLRFHDDGFFLSFAGVWNPWESTGEAPFLHRPSIPLTAAVMALSRQRLSGHGGSIRGKSDPPFAGATDLHASIGLNDLDRSGAVRTGNCRHAITVPVDVKRAIALRAANLNCFLGRFLDVEVGLTVRTICLNKEVVDDVSPPVDFKSPITVLAINEPGGEKPTCFILFLCFVPTVYVVEDLFPAAVRASRNDQHLAPYIVLKGRIAKFALHVSPEQGNRCYAHNADIRPQLESFNPRWMPAKRMLAD